MIGNIRGLVGMLVFGHRGQVTKTELHFRPKNERTFFTNNCQCEMFFNCQKSQETYYWTMSNIY